MGGGFISIKEVSFPMSSTPQRIYILDAAKALGIFLVFYGHIVERFSGLGSETAFSQMKFIFAFHMPFFFFLAGFFYKERSQSKTSKLKSLFFRRMLPVYLFGLMALPIWPLYRYLIWGYVDIPIWTEKVLPYLRGQPLLNEITWFLVCLFTTEAIAIFVLPRVKNGLTGLLTAGVFLWIGFYLTGDIQNAEFLLGISKNTWYIHEALVAFGLYTLGYVSYESIKTVLSAKVSLRLFLLFLFLTITFYTYDMNTPYRTFFVVMKESWHGDPVLFLIAGISGSLFLLLLATFLPKNKWIDFIGKNTLILIGLNGLFHAFINLHFATKIKNIDSVYWITGASFGFSVLTILLSVPAIWILNKVLPQLVGKPYREGPILPRLE
jgi:acyltransferase